MRLSVPALLLTCSLASAQAPYGPPPGFFPPNMPNVGDLWVEYCLIGDHVCHDVEVKIWGQVCDSGLAREAVFGDPRNADHVSLPPMTHYVGWRCFEKGELIQADQNGYFNDGKFVERKASGPATSTEERGT